MKRIDSLFRTGFPLTVLAMLAGALPAFAAIEFHDWTSTHNAGWGVCTYTNSSDAGVITGSSDCRFVYSPGTYGVPTAITPQNIFTNEFSATQTGNSATFNFSSGYAWGTGGQLILGNIHNYYQYTLSAWDFNQKPIDVNQWTLVKEYPSSASGSLGYFSTSVTKRSASGNSSQFYVFDSTVDAESGQGGVLLLDGLKNVAKIQLTLSDNNLAPNQHLSDLILFNVGTPQPPPGPDPCCSQKPVYYATPARPAWLNSGGQEAVSTMYAHGGTDDWDKVFPGTIPNQDVVIWNISKPPSPNADWSPTDSYFSDNDWDYGHLGDVFGLTIDDKGNIFVAATTIYYKGLGEVARVGSLADSKLSFNEKHGVVYEIDNGTGKAHQFAHLPNPNGAGLGNIAFDCAHRSFYVSNFDDGLIYQLDTNGTVLNTWDHGAMRSTTHDLSGAGLLIQNIPPSPGGQTRDNQGYALLGRRPWAVRVHQGRLYYSVWSMDSIDNGSFGAPSTFPNQIWSVALDATGNFAATSLRFELTMPLLDNVNAPWNNPVADLTFSPTGSMIVAERSMGSTMFGNHVSGIDSYARVLEFAPVLKTTIAYFGTNPSSYWDWSMKAAPTYQVGCNASVNVGYRANSAGGVDFDLTPSAQYQVWATGDKLHDHTSPYTDYVWGLQGFPAGGGKIETSILIDLNRTTASAMEAENQVGDVRIPCPVVVPSSSVGNQL